MNIYDLHELVVQYNENAPYDQRLPICFEMFLEKKVQNSKKLISIQEFKDRLEKKKEQTPESSGVVCDKCGTEMDYTGGITVRWNTTNYLTCPVCKHNESY